MPIGDGNAVIEGCGMHHIAIQSSDYEKSKHFYCDILGFKVAVEWGDERKASMLDIGDGSYIELFGPNPNAKPSDVPTKAHPLVHIALFMKGIDKAVDRLKSEGVEVTMEPTEVNIGGIQKAKIAFFRGPDGEVLEFMEYLND